MSEHFAAVARAKGLPPGVPSDFDARYYRHQVPGGVMTTMSRQLAELRRPELLDEVIDEIARVRADFGYPIVVTPYAQFLVTQATLNVIAVQRGDERYADVPDEIVRYFLGHFGAPPAPPDPGVADRVLSLPRASELRHVEPLALEGARARFGAGISDEELLLRMTMPAEQVDAMLAGAPPGDVRRRPATRSSGCWPSSTAGATSASSGCRRPTRWWSGAVRVEQARGFVFDLDGTLVQRGRDGLVVLPGRRRGPGGDPGVGPAAGDLHQRQPRRARRFIAAELREGGLEVSDDEVLTPICSTMSYLRSRFGGRPVMTFATAATRERLADEGGIELVEGDGAAAVFVAHPDAFDFSELERGARAISGGARLLTASFVAAYSGADGPIYSRGAMVTAALAKATGARPVVTGKPSKRRGRRDRRADGRPVG